MKGRKGGTKSGILGRFSRLSWRDRGREGSEKLRKMRRRLLWMIPNGMHFLHNNKSGCSYHKHCTVLLQIFEQNVITNFTKLAVNSSIIYEYK